MNKPTFDAMLAQYAVKEASGEGAASWDGGVRCVLPEVLIGGKAVQNGTPTPDAPVMPEFSAETEVVSRGKNLFDVSKVPTSANITNHGNGSITVTGYSTSPGVGTDRKLRDLATGLAAGKTYTISAATTCTVRTMIYLSNAKVAWFFGQSLLMTEDILVSEVFLYADANGETDTTWDIQIEEGTTATPYEPYYDGGTAVAPELLAIPGTEYRDAWNPQTGKGVRRVGKLVLDGTETRWIATNRRVFDYNVPFASYAVSSSDDVTVSPIVCSHYGAISHYHANMNIQHGVSFYQNALSFSFGDGEVYTADTWKAYLADQHAAGTPVTVWYALAEPVEFQTAPQPLIQPKGSCEIIQTEGTVSGCPISAKYLAHK